MSSYKPTAPLRADYQAFLAAPALFVFDAFADVEQFSELVPNLKKVTVLQTEQGTVRQCDFGNDVVVEQLVFQCEPPSVFAYTVGMPNPLGVREHNSVVTCLPQEAGTQLQWQHFFDHDDPAAMLAMLESMFEHVLAGLLKQVNGHRLPNLL